MSQNLRAIARDNMIRISPTKLSLIANSIVNMKVSSAINQLQFSSKRISHNVLKVLNAAVANAENNKQLDAKNNIVTTPAYMDAKNISEAAEGIEKLVSATLSLVL